MQRERAFEFGRYQKLHWTFALLVFLFSLAEALPSFAQSIWVQGGTSTMFRASGMQVNYNWAPVRGWFGAGWQNGFTPGGFLETTIDHYDVGIGDRYQSMTIDTDVFDQSRYFAGLGAFVQKRDESRTVSLFAGATANEQTTSFYRAFSANQPTGGIFFDQQLSSKFFFHSIDLMQDRLTSLQSFRYKFSDDFDVSAAGGLGHGSGYFSFATQMQRRIWQLTASYTETGSTFERLSGVLTNAPERVGLNVRFHFQPKRKLQFVVGHENLLSPTILKDSLPQKVSLDSANVAVGLKGFNFSGSATTSTSGSLHTETESGSVSRNLFRSVSASGSVMRIATQDGSNTILIGTVREKISAHLTLNEGISSQSNSQNFTWGAQWISNRITFGIQQDVLYTPLAGGFNGSDYSNIWSVNVIAPMSHGVRVHLDSFVDPTGKMRYTAWFDGIGWSRNGTPMPHQSTAGPSFGRFIVTGVVRDTNGDPVFGIAVQVDGQTAFTDSTGHFQMRFGKGLTYPLAVLPDRSLATQYYEVVQAPVSATAETEDAARPVLIVVRRATAPKKRRSEVNDPEPAGTTTAMLGKDQ